MVHSPLIYKEAMRAICKRPLGRIIGLQSLFLSSLIIRMSLEPPKILVVDDNFAIRHSIRLILREFRVLTASGFTDAQRLFLEHPDCEAVISDQNMPDGSGLELLEWVRSQRSTPFLLMSGDFIPTPFRPGRFRFLQKPFNRTSLKSALDFVFRQDLAHP